MFTRFRYCLWPVKPREEGSVLLFVMLITTALIFVAALGINVSLSSRKVAVNQVHAKEGTMCAETALEQARTVFGPWSNRWNDILNPAITFSWYPHQGTCPNVGARTNVAPYRFVVTMRDNVDEPTGNPNDPLVDADNMVILDARVCQDTNCMIPIAKLSCIIGPAESDRYADYTTQHRHGATKGGNL